MHAGEGRLPNHGFPDPLGREQGLGGTPLAPRTNGVYHCIALAAVLSVSCRCSVAVLPVPCCGFPLMTMLSRSEV